MSRRRREKLRVEQPDYHGLKGMRAARADLAAGDLVHIYVLTPAEAAKDKRVSAMLGARQLNALKLAQTIGLDVQVGVQEWNNGEMDEIVRAYGPDSLGDDIQLVVWDDKRGAPEYTLTRATQHKGWRLTNWAKDWLPWGHADLDAFEDAFDTDPMASGASAADLLQVVYKDGTTLVRKGAKRVPNPRARHGRKRSSPLRKLMRGL